MDKTGIIEERKQYNAPFLRAFFYLASEKKMNQKTFAQVIDAESSYISALKAGTKRVGTEYMSRLTSAFSEHYKDAKHLNIDFLVGKSEYMILENVPASEIQEKINKGTNPDYEVIKKEQQQYAEVPDMSSVFNAALAAKDETIMSLKRELQTKEKQLHDKDELIAAKDEIILSLRAQLTKQKYEPYYGEISHPIGFAENQEIKPIK